MTSEQPTSPAPIQTEPAQTAATGGKAEVQPGLVLTLSGAHQPLRLSVQTECPAALAELPGSDTLGWVFREDQVLAVLEGAVRVLRAAARSGWPCAAALSTGRVGIAQPPGQAPRAFGAALERAKLLGRALLERPGALLCDEAVARLSGLSHTTAPLLGDWITLEVSGTEPLACAEVLWDRLRPGDLTPPPAPVQLRAAQPRAVQLRAVQLSTVQLSTQTAPLPRARPARPAEAQTEAAQVEAAPERPATPLSRWVRGTILRTGRTFGFIEDSEGLVYYFQPRNVAVDVPLRRGSRVVFRILPPLHGAAELRAEDVFVQGAVTSGVLERVHPKGWGLVRLDCHNGLEHRLFVQNATGHGWRVGRTVQCRIAANRQGPVGVPVLDGEENAEG